MGLATDEKLLAWVNLVIEANLNVLDSIIENIDIVNGAEMVNYMDDIVLDESITNILAVVYLNHTWLQVSQRNVNCNTL